MGELIALVTQFRQDPISVHEPRKTRRTSRGVSPMRQWAGGGACLFGGRGERLRSIHCAQSLLRASFANANSKSEPTATAGGGAIYASGGRLKVINSRFMNNVCADNGPDVGGAGIRAFQQYNNLPIYVVNSTFGGSDGVGNTCSNCGGISSIGVSWTILNSLFSFNHAIGNGGNPAKPDTRGGGSGGAICNDGNKMTLSLCGTRFEYNQVNAFGSAIFFVSNDHTGDIKIDSSVITNNIGGSWYPKYPQISQHEDTPIVVTNSTIQ